MPTMQEEQRPRPVLPPGRVRRSFPKELKADAVVLVLDEGRSIASVARNLEWARRIWATGCVRTPGRPRRESTRPAP